MEFNKTGDAARIGKSVVIKGDLSGSEDLYVDGEIEGSIDLQGRSLIIGPNGKVKAGVSAGNISVHGTLNGNLRASDRVELKKSGMVTGDISAQRIAIEDGAFFKGKVDIDRSQKSEARNSSAQTVNAGVAEPTFNKA